MRLTFAMFLLVTAASASAQSTVRGVVTTPDSVPLPGVILQISDSAGTLRLETSTDSAGRFLFRLEEDAPAGLYLLGAMVLGFRPVHNATLRIAEGEVVLVRLKLHPSAVLLDPIEVIARTREESTRIQDYRRRAEWIKKTGFGRVIERDVLESQAGLPLPRLLSAKIPGVQMSQVRTGSIIVETLLVRGCQPTVLLDRMPISSDMLETINVGSLEGVEVYRDATEVPAEFSAYSRCGLVLAWTADREGRPFTLRRLLVFFGLLGGAYLLTR